MQRILLFIFSHLLFSQAFSQVDSLLAHGKSLYEHESIFLHTDKNNYVAGETIWLKAYLYDGMYPSTESSAIKIQLIANDSSVVSEKIYPVVSGIANGNLRLPVALAAGRYFIRTFSNGSLNKKIQNDFVMPVVIYNPSSLQTVQKSEYKRITGIQLINPNKLIAGLTNEVYVKVFDQYKQPIETTGFVLNEKNDTVNAFSTNRFGIAELKMEPQALTDFGFVVRGDEAKNIILKKDAFSNSGISMNIDWKEDKYNIDLEATPDVAAKEYYLAAEYQYQLLFKIKVNFQDGKSRITIPATQLPTGICRVVLLSADNNAMCERFLFSNNADGIIEPGGTFSLNQSDTLQSNFKFTTADSVEGTYSLKITNTDFDFDNFYPDENIINRFFFTAFLKNCNPAYFGTISNLKTCDIKAINAVLASQELLIPKWEEIKNSIVHHIDEIAANNSSYLKLSGVVKPDGYKNLPKDASLSIVISLTDSSVNYFTVPLTSDGKFELDDLLFSDTARIYYKLNSKIYKPIKLEFNSTDPGNDFTSKNNDRIFFEYYPPVILANATAENNSYTKKQQELFSGVSQQTTVDKELAPVTVITQKSMRDKKDEVDKRYTTSVFSGNATSVFDFINQPQVDRPLNVIDYLKMYAFAGRMVVGSSSIVKPVGWGNGVPYTIFIDEGMASFEALQSIDIRNVALIKVFSGSFVLANESGPAIAVYIKKSGDGGMQFGGHMQSIKMMGYSAAQEFINPDADYVQFINKNELQSTFYWNPYLTIDKKEKNISVIFYNINKVQKAKVVLQGMRSDGRLIYFSGDVRAQQ